MSQRHAPAVLEWLWLLLGTLRVLLHDRHALLVEHLLLRQQLAVALRARPRPRLRRRDRLFWAVACRVCADWRRHLVLVRPETVLRWHRRGWRLCWWWRSRRPMGRPRVPAEVRDLIAVMSRDNPLWGTERLRGELRKLGIAVSAGSIRRYRWRGPARPPTQTWRTFLRNHAHQIWAADLFTVPTLTFSTLFVLFFITHDRRELVHCRVTAHPTAAWVWRRWSRPPPGAAGRASCSAIGTPSTGVTWPSAPRHWASRPCSPPCGPRRRMPLRSGSSAPSVLFRHIVTGHGSLRSCPPAAAPR